MLRSDTGREGENESTLILRRIGNGDPASGCPECRSALAFHQPDPLVPDRLLATCPGCGAWFYLAVAPDGGALLVGHLACVWP